MERNDRMANKIFQRTFASGESAFLAESSTGCSGSAAGVSGSVTGTGASVDDMVSNNGCVVRCDCVLQWRDGVTA